MAVIICEQEDQRVIVDDRTRTVTFEYCHAPRTWWFERPSDEFTCSFGDVLRVITYPLDHRGSVQDGVAIVTRYGRALLRRDMPGMEGVLMKLKEECKLGERMPWHLDPHKERVAVVVLIFSAFAILAAIVRWFVT